MTNTWRSKRPGRSSAGSSLSSRFEAAITTTRPFEEKPSISTSSWLRVWSFSPGDVVAAAPADGVELVDEDDRRFVLAGLREQPPDAGRPEAGEHLHEGGRRLGEELRFGLVGHGLRQQRLAGARRAVQQDPLRHRRPERVEGFGSRRNSTISCSSPRASSTPAMSLKVTAALEEGLICCGLMRGITFKVRSITKMITEKKTIIRTGSQLYAKFWISWPSEAWAAAGVVSGVGGGGPHGGGDAGVGRGGVDAGRQGRALDGRRGGGVRAVVGRRRAASASAPV